MIVQTKRQRGFGAVLKGSQFTVTTGGEYIELSSWGVKEQTGEQYEFRVLLTRGEALILQRAMLHDGEPEYVDPQPNDGPARLAMMFPGLGSRKIVKREN